MDRMVKRLGLMVLTICIVMAVVCAPTVYRGYQMYAEALEAVSPEEKVAALQSADTYVPLDEISAEFKEGIIETEDHRFYLHPGVDPLAIARAVKNDLLAGSFVEGGSTITQQLAKNLYFDFDKTLERKVAEALMAFRLERLYDKDEILELYVNCINFGEDCYGIQEASDHYYATTPMDLSTKQADALVYTIKCPSMYNPNALRS